MYITKEQLENIIYLSSIQNISKDDEKELRSYLTQLDYNTILDLEALMTYGHELNYYGGIDELQTWIREHRSNRIDLLSPTKRFETLRHDFAHSYPSPDGKFDAVSYIHGKYFLKDYLYYAMDALNI